MRCGRAGGTGRRMPSASRKSTKSSGRGTEEKGTARRERRGGQEGGLMLTRGVGMKDDGMDEDVDWMMQQLMGR